MSRFADGMVPDDAATASTASGRPRLDRHRAQAVADHCRPPHEGRVRHHEVLGATRARRSRRAPNVPGSSATACRRKSPASRSVRPPDRAKVVVVAHHHDPRHRAGSATACSPSPGTRAEGRSRATRSRRAGSGPRPLRHPAARSRPRTEFVDDAGRRRRREPTRSSRMLKEPTQVHVAVVRGRVRTGASAICIRDCWISGSSRSPGQRSERPADQRRDSPERSSGTDRTGIARTA